MGDTEHAAVRAARASRKRRLAMLRCVVSGRFDICSVGEALVALTLIVPIEGWILSIEKVIF